MSFFSIAYADSRPRLVRPETRRGRQLAAAGLLLPLSELPPGYVVGPRGALRRQRPDPAPRPIAKRASRAPRAAPPRAPRTSAPRPIAKPAAGEEEEAESATARALRGAAERFRATRAANTIARAFRGASDRRPYIFRDREGRPVAFDEFPALLSRLAAASAARRLGLTAHELPDGVEPYRGPWEAPVLLVVGGDNGPRLFHRLAALQAVAAAGGSVRYQPLNPIGPPGSQIVNPGADSWKAVPRGMIRGALTAKKLGDVEKAFSALRSRQNYFISLTYLLTVSPPPPGPPPGLGALQRLQAASRSGCVLDRVAEALAQRTKGGRPPGPQKLAERREAFAMWGARLEASGGFSLEEDRAAMEKAFRVRLVPHDVAGLGLFDSPPPRTKSHKDSGAAVHFLDHNGHAFRMPSSRGGALAPPPATASEAFECQSECALLEVIERLERPARIYDMGAARFLVAEEVEGSDSQDEGEQPDGREEDDKTGGDTSDDEAPTAAGMPKGERATIHRAAFEEDELRNSARLLAGGNAARFVRLERRALLHLGTPGGGASPSGPTRQASGTAPNRTAKPGAPRTTRRTSGRRRSAPPAPCPSSICGRPTWATTAERTKRAAARPTSSRASVGLRAECCGRQPSTLPRKSAGAGGPSTEWPGPCG